MKVRALVAKTDGVADANGHALARGSVRPAQNIPVTRNFDPRLPPIGRADITVEGDDVFADIEIDDPSHLHGLAPAIGGRGMIDIVAGGVRSSTTFDVYELSMCDGANSDQRIPRLHVNPSGQPARKA